MRTPTKPSLFQGLTSTAVLLCAMLCLASGPLGSRNALHAQDLNAESVNTVAKMDSLFRTFYDPLVSPGKGKGWKPYNRMAWFYGQRAFPTGDIPAGARMQAWEIKQQDRHRRSLDENWTAIGPSNLAGRMLCIAWHPTNVNIIYGGSASGGLWKTTNGGSNWFPLTDDLPSLAVGTVALDPSDLNVVYIGTGEGAYNIDAVFGAGLFKSTDAGATWTATGMSWTQSQSRAVNKIIVHPANSQILWAATNIAGSGGVYKSTNGGTNWTRYLYGDAKDLIIHPDSVNVLFAALGYPWGSSTNGVYRSNDGGLTWTLTSTGLPSASTMGRMILTISPTSPQTLYVGISQIISAGAGLLGIYKTTDGGANWTLQASTPNMYSGQGWYNIVCEVHPTNPAIVYSAGLDCYKSTNSGVNWTQKTVWSYPRGHSMFAHADHHALAFKPGDPNTIIVGTDGGFYKSTNGGDTWSDLNNGLVTFQFYAMGDDYLNANVSYGGTQDNGTDKYNGSTWLEAFGGDGGYCNVDYTNSNIVYCSTQRGSHYKSTNGGASFFSIQSGISGYGGWVTPRVIDPANPSVLYTGTTLVYRTTNGGSAWSGISSAFSSYYVSTIAVAPSNTQVVYAGCENNGQVWKTTNGGTSWGSVSTGLPYRYITRIAVHPTDANTVYVTVSGYSSGHVWKSTNGGTSWSNSSTGLPDLPCNAIVVDPNNPNTLYTGTDLGVYASADGGATWADYSSGLPNVVIDDLSLHPTSGVLRAATHGRGMWQTPTGAPGLTVLTPNGGESWVIGTSQNITWGTGGLGGNVSIEINRTYPTGGWEAITSSTANDGSYTWAVNGPATTAARIRITSVETPSATDTSNTNFSVVQPQLTLLAPVGGESWVVGQTDTIRWSLVGATGNVVVELNRNFPSSAWVLMTITSGSSYAWTVTTPASGTARVRVYMQSVPSVGDTCNGDFAIVEPAVTVVSPNGGETLTPGSTHVIRWTRQYYSSTVKVEINHAYSGGTWETVAASVNADTLLWTVDQTGTTTARVRVTANGYPSAVDISNGNFTILTPTLALSVPNGGEVFDVGTTRTVRWTKANLTGPVNVSVNRDYPTGAWTLIAVNVSVDSFQWAVTEPYSNSARVRVTSVNLPSYYDDSNSNFVIGTGIVLSAPNGGESWAVGTSQTISWSRYNAAGAATVQIKRSYPGGSWETLASLVTASSYSWTVTGPGTSSARVRVYLNGTPSIGDTSDAEFTIPAPGLVLTAPVGGEVWGIGSSQTISWVRNDAAGNVTVQLNRGYPAGSWDNLTTTASGTSIAWTVTSPATSTARIRIYLTSTPSTGDTCNGDFSIITPQLVLSAPNGGETWLTGTSQTIRWTRIAASGDVRVQLNRSYSGGTWEILASAVSVDTFAWSVNAPTSTAARVKIFLVSIPAVGDTSTGNFSILAPALTVTSPNGGETWVIGETQSISFTRSNADGEATVQLNRNYPNGSWETITSTATGTSVAWTPSGSASALCRVRVFLNAIPSARDSSNANFSLVAASLTVTAPNGAESWAIGSVHTITWTRTNANGPVTVVLNRSYPSGTWDTLSTGETGSSMAWTVSAPPSTTARVRVSLNSIPSVVDESNANFTIVQPTLSLISPDGGETFTLGGPLRVRWSRTAAPGAVTVMLNRDYATGSWESLTTSVTVDSVVWTSSGTPSSACRIKIRLTADSTVSDVSSGDFTLIQRLLTLTSHNDGGTYYTGSSSLVSFTRTNAAGNVAVHLNRNYPSSSWETLSTTVSGNSYTWNVSGTSSTNARLRIYLVSESYVGDTSDVNFAIAAPSLVLIAPNGGEAWAVGTSQNIIWQRNGVSENVRLELKRNYPSGSWETLAASVSGTSYAWTVSGATSTTARIRVTSTLTSTISDTSNGNFSIVLPQITLLTPNGGESLNIGFPFTIRWTRSQAAGDARVELNRSYPSSSWELLGMTTADSLLWNADGPPTSSARVRVYLTASPSVGDTSAASFTVFLPSLTLTSPAGGERWLLGSTHNITWTRSGLSGNVRVELNPDYPSGLWTTLTSGSTTSSYAWTILPDPTEHACIRVVYESQPLYGDTSGDFSIVNPSLTLIYPNGGELLISGQPYTLTLSRSNHPDPVALQLNRSYPGGSWETIAANVTGNTVPWSAGGSNAFAARMRVVSEIFPTVGDTSDADFRVLAPGVYLLSPDGGEVLAIGGTATLRWIRAAVSSVDVLINRSYPGGAWETLAENVNSDSLVWTVSGPPSTACRLRVRSHADPGTYDQSSTNFEIQRPTFILTTPAAGDTFAIGVTNPIHWTRNAAAVGPVQIELNRTWPSGVWQNLGTAGGNELAWIATSPVTGNARLRLLSLTYAGVGDTLDFDFAIVAARIEVTDPLVIESQTVGTGLTVQWARQDIGPGANVFLCRSYPGGTWELLASNVTNDQYAWTVTGPRSSNACLRVCCARIPALGDSTPPFSILQPQLTLTSLNGGTVGSGNSQEIAWSRTDFSGSVFLDVNLNYPGGTWEPVAGDLTGNSYLWTVPTTLTAHARMRVRSASPPVEDLSDADFSIVTPVLTVTYPNGGELFTAGNIIQIAWTRSAVPGGVKVELNRDYPSGSWETLATDVSGNIQSWVVSGDFMHGRMRVSMMSRPEISDLSNADFGTRRPELYVVQPNGGDTLVLAQSYVIRWHHEGAFSAIKVELNRTYPTGSWEVLHAGVTTDSLVWIATGSEASAARIRVSLVSSPSITDVSDENFVIARQSLRLLSPVAGDSIALGLPVQFTWHGVGVASGVNVYVKRNWPAGTWEPLASGVQGGSWTWTASGNPSEVARFRVLSALNPTVGDTTDGAVRIGQPLFTFTDPAAADTFLAGEQVGLSWIRRFAVGAARIEVSWSGTGGPWQEIGSTEDNTIPWNVTGPTSNAVRFRVTLVSAPSVTTTTSYNCTVYIPSLTVTSPAAGQSQAIERDLLISWTRSHVTAPVDVSLERGAELGSETIHSAVTGDTVHWTATGPASSSARIVVRSAGGVPVEGRSEPFTLGIAGLALISPVGGETFVAGNVLPVRWARATVGDPVRVDLNREYPGGSWTTLAASVTDSVFNWTVTGPTTRAARMRVISTVDPALGDTSGDAINLLVPALEMHPLSQTRLPLGFPVTISWTRTAVEGGVNLYLSRDGGLTWPELIASDLPLDSFLWTPHGAACSQARLMVRSAADPSVSAQSEIFVLAQPIIQVTYPAGGEVFAIGSGLPVRWTLTDHPGAVYVRLNRAYPGGAWETVAGPVSGDSIVWTITGAPTNTARVRVVSAVDSSFYGESGTFALQSAALTLTAPVSGHELVVGDTLHIVWQRTAYSSAVRVLLRRTGGALDTLERSSLASSSSSVVASPEADQSRIIVEDVATGTPRDSVLVGGPFVPHLTILAPSDGSRWVIGEAQMIHWSRLHLAGSCNVRLNRDYPGGVWETLGTDASDSLLFPLEGEESDHAAVVVSSVSRPGIADSVFGLRLVRPTLTLTEPTASEFRIGLPMDIAWTNHEVDGSVRLELDRNYPAGEWELLYEGTAVSFIWNVSGDTTSHARLRVRSLNHAQVADTLDADLVFFRPSIALSIVPDADTLYIGHSVTLLLNMERASSADITLQRAPGGEWETILSGVAAGSYPWMVTGPEAASARLRATANGDPELGDTTEPFVIATPTLSFTTEWAAQYTSGQIVHLTWRALGVDPPYRLLLHRTQAAPETLGTISETFFDWTVRPPRAADAFLIIATDNGQTSDTSAHFAILVPELLFTSPTESGVDTAGSVLSLAWQWIDGSGPVRLDVSFDSVNGTWHVLADSLVVSQLDYTVTGPETDSLRFRVRSVADTAIFALSAPQRVVVPALTLNVAGGTTWYIGEQRWIRWTRTHYAGAVDVELTSADRAQPWQQLTISLSDSFVWTVTGPEADLVALRIRAVDRPGVSDTTDAPLRIAMPRLRIVEPNGGDTLEIGQDYRLRWTGEGIHGGVGIGLWRGDPVYRFDTLFVDTPNDSSEIWTVTEPAAHNCYLIVVSMSDTTVWDTSDARFEITSGSAVDFDLGGLPREYSLGMPYPNPFNSTMNIEYALPRDTRVMLVIYDILGREVERLVDEPRRAGYHRAVWTANRASSGVYFARILSGDFVAVRKLQLIK